MRLLHCQLQNVRLHGDLELSFSPELTVIGGPNESGKSTLVEALHRALFLKATATGAPVEALRSRLHLGQPTVQLCFEARGDTWELRKRFSGASGQVTLKARSSSSQLSGAAAEEELARLLGVAETLGSKQANSVLPSRWAHLWVRQGDAGDDVLAKGRISYDFDQLRLQLERSGGAAVQQSALDQQVEQRLEQALEENFTSRGVKKNSPLFQLQEQLDAARQRMAKAQARLAEYEAASEDLTNIGEQLERLQTVELPDLLERQKHGQQAAEAAGRLDGAVQLAAQTLEPVRLRHNAALKALQQLDGLQAEIRQRQEQLGVLQARARGAVAQEAELTAKQQQCLASWEGLNRQRQTLEQQLQLLQRLVDHAATAETVARLNAEIDSLQRSRELRQALAQRLAALPPISKPDLQQLRQLDHQLRDARTRQQAMAAGVKLLRADQPVRLDGQPLQVGEEQRLSAVFQLQVGDGVVLEITPGGGEALGDLERTVVSATQALAERLRALSAPTLDVAAELLEQRLALEQQLDAQNASAGGADPAQLIRQRDSLQQRLAEQEVELQEHEVIRRELEWKLEQPLPTALNDLQALQQPISRTYRQTSPALQRAAAELEEARLAVQRFQQQRLAEAGQLEVVRSELADREQRRDQLVGVEGDRATQASQLAALDQQRRQAEAELARLQAERVALSSQYDGRQQQQLQAQIDALNKRVEALLDQRGAAKQRCDSISATDPFAAVEQAALQLETSAADHRQMLRLTAAHQLLQQLFQEAQADLSSRYSEPLAQAIGNYLRPLVPNGPVARLSYDQSKGLQGLQLRRGQEFYDFEVLSGGMREQLAAALRLSMADVLKDAHDGCLPLVFDDAFTNSDPERVDLVKRMLGSAVDRGLQVILLTCDPAVYASLGQRVHQLGAQAITN
jgi:DNA repair exonuclease SbcCD ATPase subunit